MQVTHNSELGRVAAGGYWRLDRILEQKTVNDEMDCISKWPTENRNGIASTE